MRPQQVSPPEGWREALALEHGCLAMARHLGCWNQQLLPEWSGLDGRLLAAFPKKQPLHVEFCSGNGLWIAERAATHPDINWIAVERRFDRVRQICAKRANQKLDNLLVVWGEAELFSPHFLTDGCVDHIFINFPDPWPKNKHAHKRIMRPDFIAELIRLLRPEGKLAFVTDEEPFAVSTRALLDIEPHLCNCFAPDGVRHEWAEYGDSTFEQLWRQKGLQIHYQLYERR